MHDNLDLFLLHINQFFVRNINPVVCWLIGHDIWYADCVEVNGAYYKLFSNMCARCLKSERETELDRSGFIQRVKEKLHDVST